GQVLIEGEVYDPVGRVVDHGEVALDGRVLEGRVLQGITARTSTIGPGGVEIQTPIPGVVAGVPVAVGQQVQAGETLVVVEAMKMKNKVEAPGQGIVEAIHVAPGEQVGQSARLVTLGPEQA
ncbi:MAG: biotin/lipoyl-containing protein, partial [Candidatus Thermoplasmatota archaeon]|nr:biotin/lipoyl-containing protein [Candidatus Thermoplasmatota archaeon]